MTNYRYYLLTKYVAIIIKFYEMNTNMEHELLPMPFFAGEIKNPKDKPVVNEVTAIMKISLFSLKAS
jgi:hypothetical protein